MGVKERFATLDDVPTDMGGHAWLGQELVARTDWIVTLSASDCAELEDAARALVASGDASALARLTPAEFPLPRLGPRLEVVRTELLEGRGFVLLRGLPVDRFDVLTTAAIFMGIGAHLGRARSQNAKGHLLGHVCDLGLSSADPNVRIYQTSERQTFHTDSCDVVGLIMLRDARSGGDSLLVSALAIFAEMRRTRPDLLARLMRPMPHDRRGEVPPGERPFFEIPVFSWHADRLTVFYQRQYFDSAQRFPDARRLTADDVAALDLFDRIANDPRFVLPMRLQPGDIQFVHNHTLLHDRTAFEDHAEPDRRRHLLRLWLACPAARPLPEWFRPRYGSLTVGDRGGIVVEGMTPTVPLVP
jgi:hypothetical protein